VPWFTAKEQAKRGTNNVPRFARTNELRFIPQLERLLTSVPQPDWLSNRTRANSSELCAIPRFLHMASPMLKAPTVNFLSKTKSGRVLLHALCVLRCPHRAHWHWLGILREFAH
jgi:hypothetical protein